MREVCFLCDACCAAAAAAGASFFVKGIERFLVADAGIGCEAAEAEFVLAGFADDNCTFINGALDRGCVEEWFVAFEDAGSCRAFHILNADAVFDAECDAGKSSFFGLCLFR